MNLQSKYRQLEQKNKVVIQRNWIKSRKFRKEKVGFFFFLKLSYKQTRAESHVEPYFNYLIVISGIDVIFIISISCTIIWVKKIINVTW